jgi:hypothetical protein
MKNNGCNSSLIAVIRITVVTDSDFVGEKNADNTG